MTETLFDVIRIAFWMALRLDVGAVICTGALGPTSPGATLPGKIPRSWMWGASAGGVGFSVRAGVMAGEVGCGVLCTVSVFGSSAITRWGGWMNRSPIVSKTAPIAEIDRMTTSLCLMEKSCSCVADERTHRYRHERPLRRWCELVSAWSPPPGCFHPHDQFPQPIHIQRTRHQSRPDDKRMPYLPSFSEEVGSSPSTPRRWVVPAGAGIRPGGGVSG